MGGTNRFDPTLRPEGEDDFLAADLDGLEGLIAERQIGRDALQALTDHLTLRPIDRGAEAFGLKNCKVTDRRMTIRI